MKRKVIQLAGKTLIVSLPSKWAKKNNVEKGDEIDVEEEEKRLIISTEKATKTEKIMLNTEELGTYDPSYIAYIYQAGIDEIRVNYKNREVFKKLQEKITDLMGYEIVDQGENYVEIKNVSAALEEEFETILRRTFYILNELGKSSLEAIQNKKIEQLKDLLPLENSINKFTDFCKRVLNKRGYKDYRKTQFYYVIIRDLEKIGDYYHKIIQHTIETKTNYSKETTQLYQETNEFLELFHKLFYKFEKENATKFQEKKKELDKKAKELMKKVNKEELYIIFNLSGLIKMISDLYGPYYTTRI
ncbi:MAG: phosphate uptake regulator PhoU, partial [Nanoarchaeota archaeon]|nr:phosphate uptake regulator PhoU [Nanoarchaeota archaeon]MBU1854665.1 phosphate uptake regulator PhoU [Nanoarchaeota archaeon]